MRLARSALPFVLGLAALFGAAAPAPASVSAPSLATLVARAERIIVSEVVEVRSARDARREDDVPVTLVTVRVVRTLKGAGGSQLVLEFLGGTVGDDSLDVLDIPRFAVGDRDVLILSGTPLRVSPIVGTFHGRFRLVQSAVGQGEDVASYNGRPLAEADLPAPRGAQAGSSSRRVSLSMFENAVLGLVAANSSVAGIGGATSATPDTLLKNPATTTGDDAGLDLSATMAPDARLQVEVNLGPAPVLVDGCPDWTCALSSKTWFRQLTAGAGEGRTAVDGGTAPRVSLEWAHSVYGRLLEPDTPALSMIGTRSGVAAARVVFNPQLEWNSYGTAPAASPGPLDLASVASRELSLVAAALAVPSATTAGSGVSAAADARSAVRSRRVPSSREASLADSVQPDAGACGPGDVFVDPRLLVFDSPDHALMTAYQVGFFQPGAASPAQVVDVPLTAFLIRRVVDLPAPVATAMQTSLVADIRSAGLGTPIGLVYTYRVRGVWAGGTTGWSDSSQPFVRCTTASSTMR